MQTARAANASGLVRFPFDTGAATRASAAVAAPTEDQCTASRPADTRSGTQAGDRFMSNGSFTEIEPGAFSVPFRVRNLDLTRPVCGQRGGGPRGP